MRKIGVGIVGLGRAGRNQQRTELESWPNCFEIVAGCDTAPERLKDLPGTLAKATMYGDYEEMLKDPRVELVAIATRHRAHVPMAIRAAEMGKFVSVEKPCAVNSAEAKVLVEASKRYPGKMFLRLNRRFEGPFMKALALMKQGLLGEVNTVKLYRSVGYCRRNDWMTMSSEAGGLLTNWGPHIIDQARQFLDSPVTEMWGSVRRIISIGDGDDHIKILMRAANGRVADIEISGAHTLPGREIEIQGSRGTLVYPVDGKIKMRYVDPACEFKALKVHPENPRFEYGNFDETLTFIESLVDVPPVPGSQIWKHIYDTIAEGAPYPIPMEYAVELTGLLDQAFEKGGFQAEDPFWK